MRHKVACADIYDTWDILLLEQIRFQKVQSGKSNDCRRPKLGEGLALFSRLAGTSWKLMVPVLVGLVLLNQSCVVANPFFLVDLECHVYS
jgi:hypothetical protein